MPDENVLTFSVDREELIKDQKSDATVLFFLLQPPQCVKRHHLVDDGVLLRHWSPATGFTHGASTVSFPGANFGT